MVPLVQGEKRASTSWRKKIYAPADFKATDGIAGKCGEPSGHRVDVDCDAPEAIDAAKLLIPHTGLIHGRPGKPSSHYWFICPGIATKQYTDVKDSGDKTQMIVELRSTGGYTALPPSGHPSGDTLEWESERDPMIIQPDELYEIATNVALTAFVVRHWGDLDHTSMGHLAGFWLQGGMDANRLLRLFKTIGQLAPGNHSQEILAFAQTTISKHAAGDRVTGGPKLAEFMGEVAVSKMRGWLKFKDNDVLEEMNTRHFVVTMGKDTVVGREDMPGGIVFQQPRALDIEYANRTVVMGQDKKGNPLVKPLFREWLQSKTRRSYRRVVFSPPPLVADETDYNLWSGYAMEPTAGDCSLFLQHMRDNICSGNEEHYEYLLNLLALTVQEPGTPSGVATVLRGKPGTGKGVFVRTIGDLFGRKHYTQLDKVDQLAGHFNAALSGKIIVFADEAFWAGDKREVGALKRLITEPTLHIVRKGIDGTDEENHVHLFMATNEKWSWPAMMNERRGFLLEVSTAKMQDSAYFGKLLAQLDEGGRAALLHLLLNLKVDRGLIKRIPLTKELRIQQNKSLPALEEWWHECLHEGTLGTLTFGSWAPVAGLYKIYEEWSSKRRLRLVSIVEFSRELGAFISAEKSKTRKVAKKHDRYYNIRTLEDARCYFDEQIGSQGEWPEIDPDVASIPF